MSSQGNTDLLAEDTGIRHLQDACIVLVKTEWNSDIADALEKGCYEVFSRYGVANVRTLTVPGSVEIPFAVKAAWQHADAPQLPDAFITLGCVIRGGTPHFDYVCRLVTDGVLQLNLQLPVPVIFGVLTVDSHDQALSRTGGKDGHKGEEAALTALKMIALNRSLQKKP
jgi:6,7-dimethyl-8-ribityllumazine synthase